MTKELLIYKVLARRDEILELAKKHGVENVRVFGSVSRGQENNKSDIDFLVDIGKKDDGTEGCHYEFATDLWDVFPKKKVQVCIPETLHAGFREEVLANNVSIMAENFIIEPAKEKYKRNYLVNIERSLDWLVNYNKFIKEYTEQDVLNSLLLQGSLRSIIQQPLEEMVRYVNKDVKRYYSPEIHWVKLTKFRNLIVHDYEAVGRKGFWNYALKLMIELEKGTKILGEKLREKMEKDREREKVRIGEEDARDGHAEEKEKNEE